VKRLLNSALRPLHFRWSLSELRKLESRLTTPRGRFAIPFAFRGWGEFRTIRPRQHCAELEALYEQVTRLAPERVLEVGTAKGGTLYLWLQAAKKTATVVSVDLPADGFGAYSPSRASFYHQFPKPAQTLELLHEDSRAPETLQRTRELLGDQIDFAFLDGDHRYEGVLADFNNFGPLVRPGGLIAFHQILPQPASPQTQVFRLWDQLKKRYTCREFVDRSITDKVIGIGLLEVGKERVSPLDAGVKQ
jgi:predicted O-methyltransferase YrrM